MKEGAGGWAGAAVPLNIEFQGSPMTMNASHCLLGKKRHVKGAHGNMGNFTRHFQCALLSQSFTHTDVAPPAHIARFSRSRKCCRRTAVAADNLDSKPTRLP